METKPTNSLRDRRIYPSLARPSPKTLLSRGDKTPSARRLAEKAPSPSTFTLQRSLKPATPTPKPRSSSMPNGHKAAQKVSRAARTILVPKAMNTSLTAIERPVQEQLLNNHKKFVEVLNEEKNVEESDFVTSLVDEGNRIEEQKSDEPENLGEVLVPHLFDEVEEVPNKAGVVLASTQVEKREEEKEEHVDLVVSRVDPEVRRSIHIATVVMETAVVKKKDAAFISNDVIEETKSKLMRTRKNKVLALVGAFETVFSLQEPEGQQIQKKLQLQQIQHDQQVEQSFQNQKNQLGVDSQQNQEIQAAQKLGGDPDEVHQDQHQLLEKEEENAMLKEEGNKALERGKEREEEMLKEESDKALKREIIRYRRRTRPEVNPGLPCHRIPVDPGDMAQRD